MRLPYIKTLNDFYYVGHAGYKVWKLETGKIACGCWAWKTYRGPDSQRCCKHVAKYIDPRSFNDDFKLESSSLNKCKKIGI